MYRLQKSLLRQQFLFQQGSQQFLETISYHSRTLWLFTVNDLKTVVYPSMLFALTTGTSIVKGRENVTGLEALLLLAMRLPQIFMWTWTLLLCHSVNNQRKPNSITEDGINKPWRPLPSGRLTSEQAHVLGLSTYALPVMTSLLVGGTTPAILITILFYLYNECGGDRHWLPRNLLNSAGITTFAAGGLEVGLQAPPPASLYSWFVIIAAIVFFTIHMEDLYDQEGDAAVGRSTIPLVFGDNLCRWTIVLAILVWSVACPLFWHASVAGYAITMLLGFFTSYRMLTKRSVPADRKTCKVYNLWLVGVYLMPAFACVSAVA